MSDKNDEIKLKKNAEIERLKNELKELEQLEKPEVIIKEETPELGIESDEGVEKKPRRPRTEKQKEQFKKVMVAKMKNVELRKVQNKIKADEEKKELEEKLVKKAIAVKKKQIKKQKVLDEISDDDDEPVIEKMKKPPPKPVLVSKYKFI
jgi:hypothetical protein